MTYERFVSDIAGGESQTVEFKSWIHAKNMRNVFGLQLMSLLRLQTLAVGLYSLVLKTMVALQVVLITIRNK